MRPREIDVTIAGKPHKLLTAGGVFSPDQLDRGTQVLLRTIELREPSIKRDAQLAPLLDLGCGWGPIALSAALNNPEREIWAIDVNERSRELTAENARRLKLQNVRVEAPDQVPEQLSFGEIHSNPPIRVGKHVLHELLRHWLPRVAPGGAAYLVVAKHLGADSLQRWIDGEFSEFSVSRIARDKGFHVIEAVRDAV